MEIERISAIEEILSQYRNDLGEDFQGYRNHVCRVVFFCFMLEEITHDDKEKIILAGCFHDLGIWTADTFDYLAPSIILAQNYLSKNNRSEWAQEIEQIINLHHKLRRIKLPDSRLAELFRKADLIDVSLGLIRFGLSRKQVRQVKKMLPNAGFHKRLTQLFAREFTRHPLNPLPMMKW